MTQHRKKKLLDRVRDAIRTKHDSISTEGAYVNWIKRFILFHDKRHPKEMGADEKEWMWHKDVKTTMIYTHVLNRGGLAVRSPLDAPEQ